MKISRRALLGSISLLPLAPVAARAQALGSNAVFYDIVRQIGGIADISDHLLDAANDEFLATYGQLAQRDFVYALRTGSISERIKQASPEIQEQAAFIARLLYTGEVMRDGAYKAIYYPWCLGWKSLSFATAPGTCGGPAFGHWAHHPVAGDM